MDKKIESMESDLIEIFDKEDLNFAEEIEKEINKSGGLLTQEGAIKVIHNSIFKNEQPKDEVENKHKQFLANWKPKLSYIVNHAVLKEQIIDTIYKKDGYVNFKFGIAQMAQKEHPLRTYSGFNWNGYIFVLGRKKHFHENYGEFVSLNCLVWEDVNQKPRAFSMIVPSFLKPLQSKNSYYCLYYVEYKGLVQSEKNKDRKYHDGKCLKVAKINKTVQSSLN